MIRTAGFLVILVVLAAAAGAAQETEEVRAFTIRSVERGVWLSAADQWLVFDQPYAGTSTTRTGNYREGIRLGFAGSVYHPNLVTWGLDLRLGLAQWEGTGERAVAPGRDLTADVHFSTAWLQAKPLSFVLYADTRDDYPEYDLVDRARVSRSALGGSARWTNGFAPVSLSVEKSWESEQQVAWDSTDESLEIRLGAERTSADRAAVLRADYLFTDFRRAVTGFPDQAGTSHDARLSHTLAFGEGDRDRLVSDVRFLDLAGTRPQTLLGVTADLDVRLSENLAGQASYRLLAAGDPASKSLTSEGRLSLNHQLYESLTTSLGARGSITTAGSYDRGTIGPELDVRYRKNLGSSGILNLSYVLAPSYQSWEVSARFFPVIDERHVLVDGTVTLLDAPGADPSTVVVTDEAGILLYAEGVDFDLIPVGERLQLRRVPGGRIGDGAAVLVDYTAESDPSYQRLAVSQEAGIRLALFSDAVSLSYRYQRGRAHRLSGEASQEPVFVDDHRAEVALEIAPFAARVEYEHQGSSSLPYDSLRIEENLSWPFLPGSLASFQGVQSIVRFAPGRTQTFVELVARCTYAPTRSLGLSISGGLRLQGDGDGALPAPAWSAEAGIDFHPGALELSAGYRFHGPGNVASLQDHAVFITMRREL